MVLPDHRMYTTNCEEEGWRDNPTEISFGERRGTVTGSRGAETRRARAWQWKFGLHFQVPSTRRAASGRPSTFLPSQSLSVASLNLFQISPLYWISFPSFQPTHDRHAMASTLTLSALPSDAFLSSLDGPPPSQDFKMHQVPDVFVIPPEEEQEDNPPWCVFDAAAAVAHGLSTIPDIDTLDVALGLHQQMDNRSPSFTRLHSNASQETIIMPHRGAGTLPRLHDIDLDMEDGQTDIRSRGNGSTRNRTYDDEEIVEVVKVRRSEGMADVGDRTLKLKKSSTFRARATQALRSIKNVGKGSRRATVSEPKPLMKLAPHAADTVPSRHSYQEETPVSPARATSPTMSRRRSMTLSQMFAFKENSKENRSASRPASPLADEPLSPTSPSYDSPVATQPMSPTDVTGSHAKRLQPSPSLEDCMATPTRSLSPGGDDDGSKPTLSKRKSFRRRLSVLELQKLFTKASGSSNPQPDLVCYLFWLKSFIKLN